VKILIVHNHYRQPGGEDAAVGSELDLLESHGHSVRIFSVSSSNIRKIWAKIKAGWNAPYSDSSRKKLMVVLHDFKPDIVHVHNFFPILTPSVFDACTTTGIPVIHTLHNYRLICPNGLLMREGNICDECITGSVYNSVLHGCYRNSRLATCAVARMIDTFRKKEACLQKVDRFIALTEFSKRIFIKAGFPENKMAVKPNFVKKMSMVNTMERKGAMFVGRLSPEKGISTLVSAWRRLDIPISIIGDGPLLNYTMRFSSELMRVHGRKSHDYITDQMNKAAFLIIPSVCFEGFPLVIAEAFSCHLPVIASRLGALHEIVSENETGLLFKPGDPDSLAGKVRWAVEHPEEMLRMGENAGVEYIQKYSSEVNYKQLMRIYESVIQ